MTGTPMRDDPSEIADIMNFILPLDKQIPTSTTFNDKFLDKKGLLLSEKKNDLKDFLKGRVSYLKSMRSGGVIKEFIGDFLEETSHLKLYPIEMGSFQSAKYLEIFNSESSPKENVEADDDDILLLYR